MVEGPVDDYEIDERRNIRQNSLHKSMQTNIAPDYLKFIAIIILLISSMIMYKYEPSPIIRRVNNITQNLSNQLQKGNTDENPYGFHPFYQVHRRIQYKNPAISACHGMDPSKTILLVILSRASNAHIREAIRQTWGAVKVYNDIEIRLTFVVGVDDGMLKQIEIEQAIYHGKFY